MRNYIKREMGKVKNISLASLLFLFFISSLLIGGVYQPEGGLVELFAEENVTLNIYSTNIIKNNHITMSQSGLGWVYTISGELTKSKDILFTNILGEEVIFSDVKDEGEKIEKVVNTLSGRVVKNEEFNGGVNIYGYSGKISGDIDMNGRSVNFQIYAKGGVLKIGSPILVGSY